MKENKGTIVQVMGPVVDVAFDGGALPELTDPGAGRKPDKKRGRHT